MPSTQTPTTRYFTGRDDSSMIWSASSGSHSIRWWLRSDTPRDGVCDANNCDRVLVLTISIKDLRSSDRCTRIGVDPQPYFCAPNREYDDSTVALQPVEITDNDSFVAFPRQNQHRMGLHLLPDAPVCCCSTRPGHPTIPARASRRGQISRNLWGKPRQMCLELRPQTNRMLSNSKENPDPE